MLTVDDVTTQLNIEFDQTADLPDLEQMLAAAIEVVEGEVGPISPTSVTETLTGSCEGRALLSHYPVASVETAGLTLLPGGVVSGLPYGTSEVTYTYGRAEPTAAQHRAVLLVVKDLWESRAGSAFQDPDTGQYVVSPLLHRRVRELLAPTRLGPSIA